MSARVETCLWERDFTQITLQDCSLDSDEQDLDLYKSDSLFKPYPHIRTQKIRLLNVHLPNVATLNK